MISNFLPKKSSTLQNILIFIIFAVLYAFIYQKYSKFVSNIHGYSKLQRCQVAIIFTRNSTDCLIKQFTKNLVYSIKKLKNFNCCCSLHVFSLSRNNQSYGSEWSELFHTNFLTHDRTLTEVIETLGKYINENGFTSTVILQDFEDFLNAWQLADLGNKLSLNSKIHYILHSSLVSATLEMISLVRHMANHATILIVMTWVDYYSLIHTYGIHEKKILLIPHGISIPKLVNVNRIVEPIQTSLRYNDQDFVLLSTGSIDPNEDFKRFIFNLNSIIEKIPNLHLLIIGRESVIDSSYIENIFKTVKSLQLESKVTWINRCMSVEELDIVYKRANAYISFFDKNTLTCGNLFNAMAYGLPIISTPYMIALQILKHDRGFIVSFDDDKVLVQLIIEFLQNGILLKTFGKNAQRWIKNWTWDNIAEQYMILFKTNSFTNTKVITSLSRALTDDLYEDEPVMLNMTEKVYWSNSGAKGFSCQDIFSSLINSHAESGIYTIYSDSFLQLNGKLNSKYEIETIGLKTVDQYVIIDRKEGIEELKMSTKYFISPVQIDYMNEKIVYTSINIIFEISRSTNEIKIDFLKLNIFTNAFGLFGSTIRKNKLSVSMNNSQTIDPSKWFISEQDIFSHACEGQRTSIFGIEYNTFILPESTAVQCLGDNFRKIKLIMEGRFFDASGFASVNRKIFLSLIKYKDFDISIRSIDKKMQQHQLGIEAMLVYSLIVNQEAYRKKYQNSHFQQSTCYRNNTVIFRNNWPPNLENVSNNEILIHQQPWEFHAVPINWLHYFQFKVNEIWVPSQYGKSSFVSNGLVDTKIHLIPHGVFIEKYQAKLKPLTLPTSKTFKFLTVGGMISRKGIDVLINAYKNLFSNSDDVTLIIHSIYKDVSGDGSIEKVQPNSTAPEIIYITDPFSDMDMIRLFKSVDVYVSPYRGEGFGLTILEAMASGLPPIVTKYGPVLDFCPEECAYFIDAQVTDCLTFPCGKMNIFGLPTVIQPMWAEPSTQSLAANMYLAYTDRIKLRDKAKICQKHAAHYTWDKVADKMIQRLSQITH